MKRLVVLLGALALAAPGCGGGDGGDADEALSETAANLAEIRSGTLSLRFLATAEGEAADGEDGRVGFELEGPFAFPEGDALPVARMDYTQIAGDEEGSGTFLSTGEKAYVELDGTTYELPEEQQEEFRGVGASLGEGDGLGDLEIERWMEDPELSDGGEAGGAETDRITANLNVVNAVNDLIGLASEVGGSVPEPLDGASADQLRRSVNSATVEVLTGKDDRLLRRLHVDVDFGAPSDLPRELRGLVGAGVELELEIANPNEPVRVEEPEDAQPFPGS